MAGNMAHNPDDELNAPLGRKKARRTWARFRSSAVRWPFGRILAALAVLIVVGLVARVTLFDDPMGGRPAAEIGISSDRGANAVARDVTAPDESTMTVGDEFPATELAPGPDADPPAMADTAAVDRTLNQFGAYPQLLEETQHGPVPHIGVNGERPFDAYARASIGPGAANGKPLVAIIVTGLGLNETSTVDAITKLPDNVTLAFAPYGSALSRSVASAQSQGHEFWLEVPMEPFDYPESDPGPHTLLINQPVRTNLDKLLWLMARFGGYAGIINNLGALFTSTAGDFSPIMEEIGTRGLGFIDDGSSNRSLARQLATANHVPFTRANLQLDANPSRPAILAALDRLTEKAEQNGSAVGVISALPVSVDTLASWAAELDEAGIELVPASALMQEE